MRRLDGLLFSGEVRFAFRFRHLAFDECSQAVVGNYPNPPDGSGLTNAGARDFVLRDQLVESGPAKTGEVHGGGNAKPFGFR